MVVKDKKDGFLVTQKQDRPSKSYAVNTRQELAINYFTKTEVAINASATGQ